MKYPEYENEFLFLTNHKAFDSKFEYFKNLSNWDYNFLHEPYWRQELYFPNRTGFHYFYFCQMKYKGEEI